jgi:hypothetical protein
VGTAGGVWPLHVAAERGTIVVKSIHLWPGLSKETPTMPKYVIERTMPGAGSLSKDDLRAASQKSCSVLQGLGPQIQWVHSYVTDDKIYCVYIAPSKQLIEEHARQGGFPADRISEVRAMIDPTTASK